MSLLTVVLAIVVLLYGAAQYVLMAQALRDLARRSRVRGGNKVLWGIVILTIPIAGAMLYNWMGPTSFRSRDDALRERRPPGAAPAAPSMTTNVTPIWAARDERARRQRTASTSTGRGTRADSRSRDAYRWPQEARRAISDSDAQRTFRSPPTGS